MIGGYRRRRGRVGEVEVGLGVKDGLVRKVLVMWVISLGIVWGIMLVHGMAKRTYQITKRRASSRMMKNKAI